jgi:hypothetical protein
MRFELRTSLIAAIYFVYILIHLARLCVSSNNCLITKLNEGNEVNNMSIYGTELQCSISEKMPFNKVQYCDQREEWRHTGRH